MARTPQFLKPRLRLFLSADIVGSTGLKQTPRDPITTSTVEWFPALQGFYLEAQRAFLGGWKRSLPIEAREKQVYWGPDPEFWKVIGDEILFTKELTDSHQLLNTLSCWICAIDITREFIRNVDQRLDIKCTAWTAGFPLVNKEVALPREYETTEDTVTDYFKEAGRLLNERYAKKSNQAKIAVDYIGPSIDIGFRLCQFATARKFILSTGVAYLLSHSNREPADKRLKHFRYDGSVVLKGVFGGTQYPIFWLDLAQSNDLATLEDRLTQPAACAPGDVHAYCKKFFEDSSSYTFKPFIVSSTETDFVEGPENYEKAIASITKNYGLEIIGDEASERAAEAETPPRNTPKTTQHPALKATEKSDETPLSVSALDFVKLFEVVLNATGKANRATSAADRTQKERDNGGAIGEAEEDEDRGKDRGRTPRK